MLAMAADAFYWHLPCIAYGVAVDKEWAEGAQQGGDGHGDKGGQGPAPGSSEEFGGGEKAGTRGGTSGHHLSRLALGNGQGRSGLGPEDGVEDHPERADIGKIAATFGSPAGQRREPVSGADHDGSVAGVLATVKWPGVFRRNFASKLIVSGVSTRARVAWARKKGTPSARKSKPLRTRAGIADQAVLKEKLVKRKAAKDEERKR